MDEKLNESEAGFLAIAKRALKEARESREMQLHVHPCHYEFLLARKDELTASFLKKPTSIFIQMMNYLKQLYNRIRKRTN